MQQRYVERQVQKEFGSYGSLQRERRDVQKRLQRQVLDLEH